MRRDERLIEFSREHHITLRLGLALKRHPEKEETTTFLEENRAMLLHHFDEEEADLLPILEAMDHSIYRQRFLEEHQELRYLLQQTSIDNYPQLGELLIAHTRFEEREMFQAIQEYWAIKERNP